MMSDFGLDGDQALRAVRSIIWHQLIDVDLREEVLMDRVVSPGGHAFKRGLRARLEKA